MFKLHLENSSLTESLHYIALLSAISHEELVVVSISKQLLYIKQVSLIKQRPRGKILTVLCLAKH